MKFASFGEFRFIDSIRPNSIVRSEGVLQGIGDDCAVIECNREEFLLVTTDLLLEHIHFKKEYDSPKLLGAKSLAVNISDVAACGGLPREAFVSIAVPSNTDMEFIQEFYAGLFETAKAYDVNVLGGDTSSSRSDLFINITLTGLVRKNELLLRNGAVPGDLIALTGETGKSAAGLRLLLADHSSRVFSKVAQDLMSEHLNPRPHVKESRLLSKSGVCNAAIDVSDGLSSDLNHICSQSGVGALVYVEKLPLSPELQEFTRDNKVAALDLALNGGEDYVLLAAIKPSGLDQLAETFQRSDAKLYIIGEFVESKDVLLIDENGVSTELKPKGWDHFGGQ